MIRTTRAFTQRTVGGAFWKPAGRVLKRNESIPAGGSRRGVLWRLTLLFAALMVSSQCSLRNCSDSHVLQAVPSQRAEMEHFRSFVWELEWSNAPRISKRRCEWLWQSKCPLRVLAWEPAATRKSVTQIIFSLVLGLGLNIYNRELVKIFVRWW